MSFTNDFKHKEIPLKDVRSATKDFYEPIGGGAFGKVYKGELTCPEGERRMAAFKRLDQKSYQGRKEFWNEIITLYELTHENLVSLLHHCVEGDEKILVYEYASHGSLDRYLGDTSLTWSRRLRICLGAARGLNYLHNPNKERLRIIHRDVKSSNILLDENWTAKISDFGLSKIAPTNQQHSYLISDCAGTYGYVDPLYNATGLLSKESDVYSFGVVLLEVMFGRLCYEYRDGKSALLLHTWKERLAQNRHNEAQNRHNDIIGIDKIDMDSLQTYLTIANQCLIMDRIKRPTMEYIIKELEIALDQQEMSQDVEEITRFAEIVRIANRAATPLALACRSRKELRQRLSEGIILKGNKKITLNKNGHVCEMIPAEYFIPEGSNEESCSQRYDNCKAFTIDSNHQIIARTEFLSTDHVTYTINLLYKYGNDSKGLRVPLRYQLEGETNYSTSCVAERKDGLLSTELYQFSSNQKEHCFKINLLSETRYGYHTYRYNHNFILEGIEFLPVEHVDRPIIDIDPVRKQRLLADCVDLIKLSKFKFQWTSNEELFDTLRKGFLINNNNGKKWISIKKSMEKICMIPARKILKKDGWLKLLNGSKSYTWKTISESRFEEAAELLEIKRFDIEFKLHNGLLTHGTTYACYLVYKLPKEHSVLKGMVHIQRHISSVNTTQLFYLSPHTPIIGQTGDETSIHVKARKIKGHPKLRKDGWMEIQMWDFYNDAKGEVYIKDHYSLNSYNNWYFTGLLIQGIEFRPAKVCFSPLC